jgi:predicted 2-oxoglutarate/Fe(II)-dependent dioxygenase YbiX
MEAEVLRRRTTRSGLWVEGAKSVLEQSGSRSVFYERALATMEDPEFRRYQERSLEALRASPATPPIDDDIEAPERLR